MDINYIVMEIQKDKAGKIATLVTSHADIQDARAKYHTVLAAAAKSGLPLHGALILEENGAQIARECYEIAEEPNEEA